MGVFEHFPYVNYHELNLSWILRKLKELEDVIGSQIVDLVARAGVAENAQAISDLTETVETNAETAHTEAAAAAQAAATADNKAVAAQTTATAAQTLADQLNTSVSNLRLSVTKQITTNTNGAADLALTEANVTITNIDCQDAIALPFIVGSGHNWWVKILAWDTMSPKASQTVTLTVYYKTRT